MRGMLEEMTASELAGWEAFFALEPWGAEVEDHRAGVVASMIGNANLRKGAPPFKPDTLFPSRARAVLQASMSVADKVKSFFGWKGK